MDVADEAVMVWVGGGGGGGGGKTVAVPSRAKKKKKSTGWPIRGGVKDKRWAHARAKRPSTRGPGPPRWPPPPRPIRRAQTSPGEGRRAGRACRGGMAGREAVRRRHSLQAMRSRSSDSAPVPRPRGANCGCPWAAREPGCRRRMVRPARAPKIPSTSLSVVPFRVCSQRPRLERRPTAPQATFSSLCLSHCPPPFDIPQSRFNTGLSPPRPPFPPQPSQASQPTSCSGRPISSRCPAVEQLDLDTVEPVASRRRHWRDVRSAMRRVLAMPRRPWGSMEHGAGSMEPCWPASRPWGALARASALDHSA